MKIPNGVSVPSAVMVSLARIVSEDSQLNRSVLPVIGKSSKDS